MVSKHEIIHTIESYIPDSILVLYRKVKRYFYWLIQNFSYKIALYKIRKVKRPLNVIFIVSWDSVWKYDSIFQLMMTDGLFKPVVFVCPLETLSDDERIANLDKTLSYFISKGYPTICAYDKKTKKYINIDSLSPDIIFYSTQYPFQLKKCYNQYSLRKYLKCFVNYAYVNVPFKWSIASPTQGLMWLYFIECDYNREQALRISKIEFKNTCVTGYPIYDAYQSAKNDASVWKNDDPKFKRIIWAPHHSIKGHNGLLSFSTFIENAEKILDFAENNKDKFQFAFKPHPLLLQALYNHPQWGKEKTDAYYKKWAEGENTTLQTGTYMELFKSSDAMIHDCGSFIIEYLYTQKPVLYLGNNREEQSNIVGKKAYRCHYHGLSISDIEQFLNKVVLEGDDSMKSEREQFYNDVLLPPNGCSVAENIINEIKKELHK